MKTETDKIQYQYKRNMMRDKRETATVSLVAHY